MECKLVNYSIKLIYILRCVKLIGEKVPPYFHAEYNNHEAAFAIENLSIIAGSLPPRITGFVIEWASLHQKELMMNWELLNTKGTFENVPPLV